MRSYYRVMLGEGSVHAPMCFSEDFIGADFKINQDLSAKLSDDWRDFNKEFIPVYLAAHPGKTKIGAGLACGALWVVAKGIKIDDCVICADGAGHYRMGEVTGDYFYRQDGVLPHRRSVHWMNHAIDRADISESLRNALGAPGTVSNMSKYRDEIERLLCGLSGPIAALTDEMIENQAAFVMEKHLEDFLVQNWAQTDLGKEYDIYEEDGKPVGQQYATDTGPLDILAISKDKKTLLVVELKKGRASDVVVGQTLRYMGYVQDVLAEERQIVKGAIIALEDDQRIRRALAVVPAINFYRYQIIFKLVKV